MKIHHILTTAILLHRAASLAVILPDSQYLGIENKEQGEGLSPRNTQSTDAFDTGDSTDPSSVSIMGFGFGKSSKKGKGYGTAERSHKGGSFAMVGSSNSKVKGKTGAEEKSSSGLKDKRSSYSKGKESSGLKDKGHHSASSGKHSKGKHNSGSKGKGNSDPPPPYSPEETPPPPYSPGKYGSQSDQGSKGSGSEKSPYGDRRGRPYVEGSRNGPGFKTGSILGWLTKGGSRGHHEESNYDNGSKDYQKHIMACFPTGNSSNSTLCSSGSASIDFSKLGLVSFVAAVSVLF